MAYYVQQQPAPISAMVVGGNRNAKNLPVGPDGREWSHGLCSCGDVGACCMAWCFPCIIFGQVKRRYEHLNAHGIPDPQHGGLCNSDCVAYGLIGMCGCAWILQMGTRKHVRERYNIKGGGCGDCCTAFCCAPCELSQESQELELEEKSLNNPVQPQAYVVKVG